MHADLANVGWTEEQWNRINAAVAEEAQKARIAARVLPTCGPEHPSTLAVPNFTLGKGPNRETPLPGDALARDGVEPRDRLEVDSYPTLYLTRIAVNIFLHSHEVADPEIKAALVMFRRAANYIARIEDVIVFHGRPGTDQLPAGPTLLGAIPHVFTVKGRGPVAGIFYPLPDSPQDDVPGRIRIPAPKSGPEQGQHLVSTIVKAIDALEQRAQLGPYACILSHKLFEAACTPTESLVLPRDRILPFLQGPLLRTSTIMDGCGVVLATSGSPVELVVASDIEVRYLQTTLEPRFAFRVSERVALRIKEDSSIAILASPELMAQTAEKPRVPKSTDPPRSGPRSERT
ncbi:MAG: family 1 encapsulin nanocompartment shell protein [Polyangiaceae bacterium]|jgi:uncharacterized linocin/CFP29 family protein